MKDRITGIKAWETVKNAERKYTRKVLVSDDPWWGKTYDMEEYVIVEGATYLHTLDRDRWDVLTKIED